MRLLRFARNDEKERHCEEVRRGSLFGWSYHHEVYVVLDLEVPLKRLLRFARNDEKERHCEEVRRGSLFVY